jgi:hypothetical protein
MSESGLKLSDLLPVSCEEIDPLLRDHIADSLPGASWLGSLVGFAGEVAAEKVGEVLDVDLFELIAGAWALRSNCTSTPTRSFIPRRRPRSFLWASTKSRPSKSLSCRSAWASCRCVSCG